MSANVSAAEFIVRLEAYRSPEQARAYQRTFKSDDSQSGEGDRFLGVRMGQVFTLAK